MALLERDTQLAELAAARRDAGAGNAGLVLVTGEAGVGKTALVKRFAEQPGVHVLWGLCDDLVTPRPLGPFRDMFPQLGNRFDLETFLDAVLSELSEQRNTAIVVEDAHWADQATLDAIRFLGRRVGRMRSLLVVTYRDDEVPANHPLRVTLGAVPSSDTRRIRLSPLSAAAVAQLAQPSGVDAAALYELTGGNPFYVTESLADPASPVPLSVQDAVMARVGRLGAFGRSCTELASAVPGPVESWLLDACGVSGGLDEAVRLGVLRPGDDSVSFSHELVRRAVERSLGDRHRRVVNGRILDALAAHDADPARLTHHAVQAGRVPAVVRYAPLAAARAASLGADNEAFEHYRRALEHAEAYSPDELLDLLDSAARAGYRSARFDEAQEPAARAVEMCRASGRNARLGALLCLLADLEKARGRGAEAHTAADEAVAVLGGEPGAGERLMSAYALQAKLAMLDHRPDDAIGWGEKAIALAGEHQGLEPTDDLLVTVGTARMQRDAGDSRTLVEALHSSVRQRDLHSAARAYINLASEFSLHMRYEDARPYIEEGLAHFEEHDEVAAADHMRAVRAAWYLERGRWAEAEQDATAAPKLECATRVMAWVTLGSLQARRGDPDAAATLDEAAREASRAAEAQLLVPVGLARAELAWLSGNDAGVRAALDPLAGIITEASVGRWIGEAALMRHRVGDVAIAPDGSSRPYALQVAGHWYEAADAWERLGRPYNQADALADAPDPESLLDALTILNRLGAAPRAAMVRRKLAGLGVGSVPRGPHEATRANPAGLTRRQTEVLQLLAEQLTYRGIADRLRISIKTVDHHVTAVRNKLGVDTREDAVAAGRRLRILP